MSEYQFIKTNGENTDFVKMCQKLEENMMKQGYRYAILETGELLVAVSAMYRSTGYEVIPNYGQYKDMKESLCMRKRLGCHAHL